MTFEPPATFNVADYFLGDRLREGLRERVALRLDDRTLTYADVDALADRFAAALSGLGVERADRVLVSLPDGPEFVGALFAILKLGAVVVMVNPELEPQKLAALIASGRPRAAVADGSSLAAFESARASDEGDAPAPRLLAVGGGGGDARFDPSAPAPPLAAVATGPDDPAIWLFSGGTTGAPKAVVQTHRSFANTTECYAKRALGYGPEDVTLSVPKLFFGYATGSNLFFPFSVGASAVLFSERPTPEVLFEKIRRHRPTILVNVPTMVNRMVSHPGAAEADLSSLRFATSAGEALPAPLYRRWVETFGVELLDGLGTAEMWHIFLSNLPGAVRPGTLGRAVPGFEIRVCDESGDEVPPGDVGRLWVRGGSLAQGYWEDPAKTAEAFRGDWFVGGDLVSRDADGWVTYCGRGDDVLKVAGKWLAPQEVESCLMRHDEVVECAVVGVENEDGLTKPYAFVVARAARPDLGDELKRFVLENLQPYKHPREVVLVDSLPRTHLGKIDRARLKRELG